MSDERLRRWRLALGGNESDGIGLELVPMDIQMDKCLEALYDSEKKGGLGPSSPNVARWLGDIRGFFPVGVVQVMQKDAIDRLGLQQMLLEPESLRAVAPDVNLVATLLTLGRLLPTKTQEIARQVVRKVCDDLERRLADRLRQSITGSISKSVRNRRPRWKEIDWDRTIRANLKHYQPEYKTIVPEVRIGHGRRANAAKEVILCLDQSGSMASSVVYAGIFGAVMATMKSIRTQVVAFDTAVVDLTDELHDPVQLLFATRLGGGTDIERALTYCQSLIRVPSDTILILITDLFEGGNVEALLKRAASLQATGVNFVTLLALSDQGAPSFDHEMASHFAALGIPAFACTPDLFPELMAAAIKRDDLRQWAGTQGITTNTASSGSSLGMLS